MSRLLLLAVMGFTFIACSSIAVAPRVIDMTAAHDSPAIPVTGSENFAECGGVDVDVQNADFEQAIVEATNEVRMQAGLSPLKRVDGLDSAARYHAADMSIDNYFSHDSQNREGNNVTDVCDTWARIEDFYDNWLALGENIAAGQRRPSEAMDGWMNSPDHKQNILSTNYSEIGVGFIEGEGEYRYYWVQDFGNTNGRFPLVIEGEKAHTKDPAVSIYIYGDWQAMRLRNNDGEWTPWIDFQTEFDWVLPSTPGQHTVTAELRGPGIETTTSDTIILDGQTGSQ